MADETTKAPVDMVMAAPGNTHQTQVPGYLVAELKARGFVEVCTVEEAEKKAAADKKAAK